MDDNILSIQKNIFNNLKKKALLYEQDITKDLKLYKKNTLKFSTRTVSKSNYHQLLAKIKISQIIYLGDFHTFDQNSKNLERITKYLINKSNLIIGVEFINHKYQIYIDHYLKELITEREFIESINYKNSWRFPWQKFRIFFSLAKANNLKIIALNSNGTLDNRDKISANIIVNYQKLYPKSKFLILYGELHLMPNKLPQQVQDYSKDNISYVIIHQNIDDVYWKTRHWSDNQKQIVKFNTSEYILQTSAPWIKYESLLYWYENIDDDPEFDLHDYIIETGKKTLNSNSNENFIYLIEKIASIFKIPVSKLNHDFNLLDHLDLDQLLKVIHLIKNSTLKSLFNSLIQNNDFFFLPNTNIFYCPNYSINRLSYLSGIKLFIDLNPSFSKLLNNKQNISFFIYYLHIHYFAYIASKMINPYRKTDMAMDIKMKEKQPYYSLAREMYRIRSINQLSNILKNKKKVQIYHSTKIFAFSIAEYIFEKIYNQKKLSYTKFINFKIDENQFLEISIINNVLSNKEIHKQKKRYF